MPIQGVEDVPLTQIPDFQGRVVGRGEQVSAIGVEVDLVHVGAVGIVVLNQPLASDVPNFDGFVLRTTGHTSTVGMELN